jgi:hypothetical protein
MTHIVLEVAGTEITGVFKDCLDVCPGQTLQIVFAPGKGLIVMFDSLNRSMLPP